MLPRQDFIFTIGYDGPIAVVDNQAKKKYGKLSTKELAEKGLFRAAYSSAVFSGNKEEFKLVADAYKRLGGDFPEGFDADLSDAALSALSRLFGVIPVDVKRSIFL